MPTLHLTDAAIRRLRPPESGRVEYWDTQTKALGLRVGASGQRSWVMILRVLKGGRWVQQRLTLGRYPAVTLAQAREKARAALALAGEGENPGAVVRAERQAKAEASRHTFAAVREDFLLKYRGRGNRRPAPRTLAELSRVLSSDLFADWGEKPLVKIERRDVLDVLDVLLERGVEVAANRTLSYLHMLFGWSVERGILTANPAAGIKKPGHEASRERVLSASELVAIWHASEPTHTGDLFGPIVRVLLLTGQRRDEVGGMRWSEVDIDGALWTLPAARAKNHREHLIPLSAPVLAILAERRVEQRAMRMETNLVFTSGLRRADAPDQSPAPFSGWSRSKGRLDARAQLDTPWTLHDLRRTAATRLGEDLRVPPHVVESVLNLD
ncbi:tyrosine-type recombinase/integrase [Allochromatium palmeri]|uniref:DUF4102 domain-containing protein n=1 Tax=Allochromatium palmeri TaxID=231048 RepID=A0A6N8EHY5_9GAMM|nr:integrase arm-type DNA-binding domain-containing protein [Allochromatium palmeri]MTW23231.1 DUF4102 domain-containing protein [Allochromatium palmeri]